MRKYIVTHEVEYKPGERTKHTNGFIIANHYSHDLDAFMQLAREATNAFPSEALNIECRTVLKSSWCKGCPIIRFPLPVGSVADGWEECERLPDVVW